MVVTPGTGKSPPVTPGCHTPTDAHAHAHKTHAHDERTWQCCGELVKDASHTEGQGEGHEFGRKALCEHRPHHAHQGLHDFAVQPSPSRPPHLLAARRPGGAHIGPHNTFNMKRNINMTTILFVIWWGSTWKWVCCHVPARPRLSSPTCRLLAAGHDWCSSSSLFPSNLIVNQPRPVNCPRK